MARRDNAEAAAQAASEAARVLQSRQQEAKTEPSDDFEQKPEVAKERKIIARNPVRESAMENIRANRGEPKEEPVKEEIKEEKPKEEPKAEEPKAEEPKSEEPKAEEPKEEPKVEVRTVRVKVDGEEFDAPADEVEEAGGIRAYQREKASENRLKKANEALAESKRIAAWMAQQAQQVPQKPQVPPEQIWKEKVNLVRFGSEEESAQALQELIQLSNPRTDPNQIIQRSVNEMQRQQAINAFVTEFQDLNANPLLSKLVVTLVNERLPALQQQGMVDWTSFYRSIGNEVRSVAPRQSQPQEPTSSTSQVSDKEARKSNIVNLPQAASRAALPEESKPETREESLNRMRKARGLPVG